MTSKVELFKWYHISNYAEDMIWDDWFEWRLKRDGISRDDKEAWQQVLNDIPGIFTWEPNLSKGVMRFEWEGGSEEVPLTEFYSDEDEQPDVEMLWHSGYYDGPLSGMARYNSEDVWFDCTSEDDYGDRVFGLYRLSEEDKAELWQRHEIFREMVGHHTDHHPDLWSPYKCHDEKFKKYYEMEFSEIDRTKGEKLAEVHWFQFKYWSRPR